MDIKEEYRDIPGYEGTYKISNSGNIISVDRWIGVKFIKGIELKSPIRNGYKSIILSKNAKKTTYFIHQLVAITFLGHKKQGHKIVVDHIDNNKLNNNYTNLQLISQRDNFHKGNRRKEIKGVWFEKARNKWRASISINGKQIILGRYKLKEDAENMYKNKLNSLKNEY
jgi:hypothetical protein